MNSMVQALYKSRIFLSLILIIPFLFAGVSFAKTLKIMPVDHNGKVAASGSEAKSWWDDDDTDGTFNEIELPAGTECKSVLIQVISSVATTYTNDIGFHFSSTGSATQDWTTHVGGLIIDVGKDSGSLGYVRAAAGNKVAILVLY